eukprot:gnl/Carplike_NY0171/5268_a7186_278.p1 GENE.gnl/Carplike_NY0171/5268_a7186_278~~gnl/Carplike_NY0171/5268_a7186_278.p1  ORF type:complete len:167 (+),score=14.82 gnl/Carplike_NY0171/5268_a7186_278:42-542(+)
MTDTIKIAIIGPRSTGKSSLVDYYVNDELPLKDFQSIPLKSTLRILSKEKETKYGHKKIDFFDFGGDATLSQIVTFSPLFDAVAIVIKAGDKSAARDLHAFYSAIATTKVGSKIIVFANRKSLEEHAQEMYLPQEMSRCLLISSCLDQSKENVTKYFDLLVDIASK